jgi:hypothetical protein
VSSTQPSTSVSAAQATAATPRSLAGGCTFAAVVLLLPRRTPVVVGPFVAEPRDLGGLSSLRYPADGSIVTGSSVSLADGACARHESIPGRAQLRSLSLFSGAVTASQLSLTVGRAITSRVVGLAISGKSASAAAGTRIPLGGWGYVVSASRQALLSTSGGVAMSALAVHLLEPHGGLPAGTAVLVAVASVPTRLLRRTSSHLGATQKRRRSKRRAATHEPLKVTPPLGQRHYVFPVVGTSEYIDTYGAFRSDVPGNWHHGDDIFAALGAPVVAVAGGTINRVGWEKLGGWRLWVRDSVGDEFYYAHLAGYAPTDLRSNRVRAGEVIGFIGNTGDAFTTSPHLHFEIHPRPLLHLGYDGAVDPTGYLDHWAHVARVRAPRPAHPPFPLAPVIRREARYVFRELLAARHLIRRGPNPSERPHIAIPPGANGRSIPSSPPLRQSAPRLRRTTAAHGMSTTTVAFLSGLASLVLFGSTLGLSALLRKSEHALALWSRIGRLAIFKRDTQGRRESERNRSL